MGPFSARREREERDARGAHTQKLTEKSLCTEKRSIVVNGADIMSRFISALFHNTIYARGAAVPMCFRGAPDAAA
jgi:hypothetical protein